MGFHRSTHEGGLYFTTTTVKGWVDVFTRKDYVYEVIECLKFCQEHKGLEIYAYVIMPNHLHMICRTEHVKLQSVLRDLKSYSAKRILQMINEHPLESRSEWMMYLFRWFARNKASTDGKDRLHHFWESGNYPIDLRSYEMIKQKMDYIHNNPVRAGFVEEPQHWRYSSAHPHPDIKVLPLLY